MTNPSWGTKRNCPSCNAHFYDLNKVPAVCPKCKHSFDPAVVMKGRRKAPKRTAPEERKVDITPTILVGKKAASLKKKDKKPSEDDDSGGIGEIAEMDDVDDIENLQDLSELEEIEESPANSDDADDETIIEDMQAGEKALVGNVEEEEAKALVGEIEDEQESQGKKKLKVKARRKAK